jgi:hypothetical protein
VRGAEDLAENLSRHVFHVTGLIRQNLPRAP